MAFSGWGRRCELVVQSSQVAQDCTDFSVQIHQDSLPSEIFDADGSYPALNGGGDLRFSSDEVGDSQLPCEIEQFITDNDPANGKSAVWVKRTLSSASNTSIWIHYNKAGEVQPSETDPYGKHAVWDSNYKMVQHMNQDPSGSAPQMIDSTSNSNDGTSAGTMTSADLIDGQIGKCLDFEGTDDYINVNTVANDISVSAGTLKVWINRAFLNTEIHNKLVFSARTDSNNNLEIYGVAGGTWTLKYKAGGVVQKVTPTADTIPKDTWTLVDFTWDVSADSIKAYINGAQDGVTVTNLGTWVGGVAYARIGDNAEGAADSEFFGLLDEFRVLSIARPANWILTEYNNQNSPATFIIADVGWSGKVFGVSNPAKIFGISSSNIAKVLGV